MRGKHNHPGRTERKKPRNTLNTRNAAFCACTRNHRKMRRFGKACQLAPARFGVAYGVVCVLLDCPLTKAESPVNSMNVFTTDHPMASEPFEWSWFNRKKHPRLSLLCSMLLVAFIFSPLVLYWLYCWFMSDIGAESNPFPEPWRAFFMGLAVSFVMSLPPAFLVASVFRIFLRHWRKPFIAAPASLTLAAIFLVSIRFEAGAFTLEDTSPHFSTNVQIIWKAPTNDLRAQYWVYIKHPQTFSQPTISNAIVLASLQDKGIPKPPTNLLCWDFDNCPCGHPCTFTIDPQNGRIGYTFPGFRNGSPEGIPSNEEIARRAWDYASRLGVDPKRLTQQGFRTNFCEYDNKGHLATSNACGRVIHLTRRLDGVDFYGDEHGFSVEFGQHGQLRNFYLTWLNLVPYERHQTAKPEQMLICIRAHRSPLIPGTNEEGYFDRLKLVAKARKVTITKITPYYVNGVFGETPKENGGEEQTRFVFPFAVLNAIAESDHVNVNILLACPILVSDANRLLSMKFDNQMGH